MDSRYYPNVEADLPRLNAELRNLFDRYLTRDAEPTAAAAATTVDEIDDGGADDN